MHGQQSTISIFAASLSFSDVSLPSSSINAGKNVPLPWTSARLAANSDATVKASTLTEDGVNRNQNVKHGLSLPSNGGDEHVAANESTILFLTPLQNGLRSEACTRAERRDTGADHASRTGDLAQIRVPVREFDDLVAIGDPVRHACEHDDAACRGSVAGASVSDRAYDSGRMSHTAFFREVPHELSGISEPLTDTVYALRLYLSSCR